MLDEFIQRAKARNIKVNITDNVVSYISKVGFDETYGARPLKRAIQSHIEDAFAEAILDSKIKDNSSVEIDYIDDKIVIKSK